MRYLGLVLALALGAGCSAVVSPDESRLGPRGGGADAGPGIDAGPGTDGGGGGTDDGGGGTDGGGGRCTAGEVETVSCGRCGTATRTCSDEGRWQMGACTGEGTCSPGETVSLSCGVDGTVEGRCTAACEMPALSCPLDVMLLIDRTGSHNATVNGNVANIMSRVVDPLLAAGDVRVGVSVFADYPFGSYGRSGDRPFIGLLEPSADASAISSELSSLPTMSGEDLPESAVEGLYVLSGGDPHSTSEPFSCGDGTVAGGCWRRNAERAIVVITDIAQHNMPSPTVSGLVAPYAGELGAPTWSDVRPRLTGGEIGLFALVRDRGERAEDGSRQLRGLVTDLGDDPDQTIVDYAVSDGATPSLAPQLGQLGDLLLGRYFP